LAPFGDAFAWAFLAPGIPVRDGGGSGRAASALATLRNPVCGLAIRTLHTLRPPRLPVRRITGQQFGQAQL
jgi:hypothetical protein